jgi:signal transduction histidine kinase
MSTSIESVAVGEHERQFSQMARKLRRAHTDLDHFIRALSHDMSANFMLLESAFSRLQRALRGGPPEQLDELASHVEACLSQSRRFLDDLIHLAKTGSVEMDPERVELAAVVDEVLFEQDELLRGQGIHVEVRRPLPAVWYNRQRLRQIITNLVRNAIKHGCDPESPRIEIQAERESDSAAGNDVYPTVRLRIHDNGRGIDPRFAEEVFLPGKRLVGSAEDGSGMGLAIVRKIAEHYGGAACVEYRPEGGATFAVVLPGGFAVPAPGAWKDSRMGDRTRPPGSAVPPRRPHIRSEVARGPH